MLKIEHQGKKYKITEYLNTQIFVVDNVLDIDTCAQIVSDIKTKKCDKLVFTTGNNVECFKVTDCEDKCQFFMKKIFEVAHEIIALKNIPISGMYDIEIRKVYGETRMHQDGTCPDNGRHPTRDHTLKIIRSLTIVGVLNDDYEGGEYSFPSQNIKIKLKAGSFIMFPPYWTHPHSVSKIITKPNCNEYRYIVSTWVLDNFYIKYDDDDNINNIIVL
jgi:hypothetical protein